MRSFGANSCLSLILIRSLLHLLYFKIYKAACLFEIFNKLNNSQEAKLSQNGQGFDLFCGDHQCYSNLGYAYQLPSFLSLYSNEANSFLAGSYNFEPVEIEVYWVDSMIIFYIKKSLYFYFYFLFIIVFHTSLFIFNL